MKTRLREAVAQPRAGDGFRQSSREIGFIVAGSRDREVIHPRARDRCPDPPRAGREQQQGSRAVSACRQHQQQPSRAVALATATRPRCPAGRQLTTARLPRCLPRTRPHGTNTNTIAQEPPTILRARTVQRLPALNTDTIWAQFRDHRPGMIYGSSRDAVCVTKLDQLRHCHELPGLWR